MNKKGIKKISNMVRVWLCGDSQNHLPPLDPHSYTLLHLPHSWSKGTVGYSFKKWARGEPLHPLSLIWVAGDVASMSRKGCSKWRGGRGSLFSPLKGVAHISFRSWACREWRGRRRGVWEWRILKMTPHYITIFCLLYFSFFLLKHIVNSFFFVSSKFIYIYLFILNLFFLSGL